MDDVISLLKDLAGNPVSFVILGAIFHTPRKLTIVPESERPERDLVLRRPSQRSALAAYLIMPTRRRLV